MKHFAFLLLILVFFTACKSTSPIITSKKSDTKKEKLTKSDKRKINHLTEELIDAAAENLGVKYKYAGTTKAGFDCSGLMYTIFSSHNITLPRSSYQQSKIGEVINTEHEQAQKGDLIFFKTNKNSQINHVGIVIEVNDDEIKFIHSSTSKGVIISSTKEPYYKKAFTQLNRVL